MTNKPQIQPDHADEATGAQKARLLSQMDVTMIQKLAFASAHLQLHDGARILDIGCAAGKTSFHIAALNPHVNVVGIDYDHDYVSQARRTYKDQKNLRFEEGNARYLNFALDQRFDVSFSSSFNHEPTSWNNYDPETMTELTRAQLGSIKPNGIILLRDFMRASNPDQMVYYDLPAGESKSDNPEDMSYPDFLRLYSRIADSLKPEPLQGFLLEEKGKLPDGWERFYLSRDRADEFTWRKEYRSRAFLEAREKYGHWTAEQYRSEPEKLGARVLYTAPYYNPWVMRNWYEGKVRLYDKGMNPLPLPPTNFIAVIQKIRKNESQRFREHRAADTPPNYLKLEHFKNTETGAIYDIVSRPGRVYDVIPYRRKKNGGVDVFAKTGYPRPLVNIQPRNMTPNLDSRTWSGHMVEPLAVAGEGDDAFAAAAKLFRQRTRFKKSSLGRMEHGMAYFTAPADGNEKVSSVFAELHEAPYESRLKGRFSNFSTDGTVRAYDIQYLLRGVQVGMLPEARLEMNIYALMHRLNITPEPWIGDTYELQEANNMKSVSFCDLAAIQRHVFRPTDKDGGHIKILRSIFIEEARKGVIGHQELEFAVPNVKTGEEEISTNSVMAIPLVKDKKTGAVMIGLQRRDFPAVQQQDGQSSLVTIPGFRLPSKVKNIFEARDFIAQKYPGARVSALGESYFPTMGMLPDRIFPHLVTAEDAGIFNDCTFVSLQNIFANFEKINDAHLAIAVSRAVHALGLWEEYTRDIKASAKAQLTLAR